MKVLVTGGAGYLGAALVPALLDAGHDVTVLDSFRHGVPSLAACCHHPRFALVRGDAHGGELKRLVAKADAIIPLAALVGAAACDRDPTAAITTNENAIDALYRAASREQLILYPNTNSGYGAGGAAECTEDTPLQPLSLYGSLKAHAEAIVLEHPHGVSFRFATLFGASPRMRLDLLVNDFVYRAVRDRALTLFEGGFRRNYLHVRDAASAFVFALEAEHYKSMAGYAFNVGLSDANLTKRALCQRIQRHVPDFCWFESPIGEDPDQRDYVVSNARIEATGWRPRHSLDDGITELVKLYQMPFEGYCNA